MNLYDLVKDFVGPVPIEFEFIYLIIVLVISLMLFSFIFAVFKLPLKFFERK